MHRIIAILSLTLLSLKGAESISVTSFNADNVPIAKGTPVAIYPSNGGFVRASSAITNCVFGILAQDAPLGITTPVMLSGSMTLNDWTTITAASALQANVIYYVSATAGKLATASSGTGQSVGYALSANTLIVNVELNAGGGGGGPITLTGPVTGTGTTTIPTLLDSSVTNQWRTDATNAAQASTNGLGSAAFTSSSAYDAAGTAQHATNGLGSAAFTSSSAYDASGTALNATNGITSAWIQGKFPSVIITNGNANDVTMSNAFRIDAAHSLSLSNLTTGHVTKVGSDSTLSSVASGAVPINGDGSATTSAQVQSLFPSNILTNNYASGNSAILLSNAVAIDKAHSLSLSNLTISRHVMSGADNTLVSATASGAVPVDADGSATTFAQINALAPGLILTNNLNTGTPIVLSNHIRIDAAHQLVLSNVTPNHILIAGIDNSIAGTTAAGPAPINGDGSATTFAQIQSLASGTILTNGNSTAATLSNNVTVDAAHVFFASDTTNNVTWNTANYVVTVNDTFILISGAHTATMPSPSAAGVSGKFFWIQCSSSGTNAILPNASETFNVPGVQGATKLTNTAVGKAVLLWSNRTNWWGTQF
jgi:hypothetical protein